MSDRAEFYRILTAAIEDLTDHGFDSQVRLEEWLERLRRAAAASLVPEHVLERNLKDVLERVYRRTVEGLKLIQMHPAVSRYTLERVKPKLRAELDRRIMASANLIRLNRQASIERTLQRFAGWATSIPIGGTEVTKKREEQRRIRRGIAGLSFEERRVTIDQGHKLVAAINDIVAQDGGAIALTWRHVNEGPPAYDARPNHVARDGHIFVLRDNWAMQKGLMKLAGRKYYDQVTAVGEEPFCRCLPGSTRIPFANVQKAYRRWYDGVLLEISTTTGKALSVTPNHPVLTAHGWRSADSLNVGDHLVETSAQIVDSAERAYHEDDAVPMVAWLQYGWPYPCKLDPSQHHRPDRYGDEPAIGA